MKRTLAVAALLTITGGGTYALANSHPAAPYRTTSPAPVAEILVGGNNPTSFEEGYTYTVEPKQDGTRELIATPVAPESVTPRSGRAVAPTLCGAGQVSRLAVDGHTETDCASTHPAITILPDGNLTAIAQGPSAVPNTNPSSQPVQAAPTVSGASEGAPAAPVVWEWRSPTRENGWTQSGVGATGCWSAYGINGRPMERQAPNEVNQHNWEVMRRSGARSIDCDSPDVQVGWDPTVPLVVE